MFLTLEMMHTVAQKSFDRLKVLESPPVAHSRKYNKIDYKFEFLMTRKPGIPNFIKLGRCNQKLLKKM